MIQPAVLFQVGTFTEISARLLLLFVACRGDAINSDTLVDSNPPSSTNPGISSLFQGVDLLIPAIHLSTFRPLKKSNQTTEDILPAVFDGHAGVETNKQTERKLWPTTVRTEAPVSSTGHPELHL